MINSSLQTFLSNFSANRASGSDSTASDNNFLVSGNDNTASTASTSSLTGTSSFGGGFGGGYDNGWGGGSGGGFGGGWGDGNIPDWGGGYCGGLDGIQGTMYAQSLLKKPPFAPTDTSLFSPAIYSSSTAAQPASAAQAMSPTQIESTLRQTLSKQLGSTSDVNSAMQQFNSTQLKAIVPDPNLRAGLMTLKGTAGESAIDSVMSGKFAAVKYGPVISNNAIAEVQAAVPPETKPTIVVNERYKNEDFRLIASSLAHEPLHEDSQIGNKEESIASAMDSLVYGQIVANSPEIASSGTELAQRDNTKLMARINSRDANGNLRLSTSTGNVYPGGTALANFGSAIPFTGADTPGNATLRAELKAITGQNNTANFDSGAYTLLDNNQQALSATDIVKVARALKLDIPT
jgi:hypothetical protein